MPDEPNSTEPKTEAADKARKSSFAESGFLSDYAESWSIIHREKNKEVFDRAHNLNSIAHGLLYNRRSSERDIPRLELYIFGTLFVRALSNFQTCMILLHRGLNLEARILSRSCLECAFMLAAARSMGAEFVDRLIKSHNDARKKYGNSIVGLQANSTSLSEDEISELKIVIEHYKNSGTETFNFEDIAKRGGLGEWYVFYRYLSNFAAHPSLDSLQYFFDEEEPLIVFEPRRDSDELGDIANLTSAFMLSCCDSYNHYLGEDNSVTDIINAEFKKLKRFQEASESGELG